MRRFLMLFFFFLFVVVVVVVVVFVVDFLGFNLFYFFLSALGNTKIFRKKNTTEFLFSNPVCLDHFTQGTYVPKICSHVHVTVID